MRILVTGGAGFIGYHLVKSLMKDNEIVIVDNVCDYYDVKLKEDRLKQIDVKFYKTDFSDLEEMDKIFSENQFDIIVHLGAQAGVRYSIENPHAYEKSNLLGTLNIFELARKYGINKIVYASSSSVYGGNKKTPFSEEDNVDNPVSLYAATKKSNELMASVYNHLYKIDMVGLRFFTVYGEFGRPDMAYFKFTRKILEGEPIDVYNFGEMKRDFTYIDDIVDGVVKAMDYCFGRKCCEIFNLGNSKPVELGYFIEVIEKEIGKKAVKNFLPMQQGDVLETYADISKAKRLLGWEPKTNIEEGIGKFVKWFREYYGK